MGISGLYIHRAGKLHLSYRCRTSGYAEIRCANYFVGWDKVFNIPSTKLL